MIGLSGSHRTGKTTLAESLAKRLELPFVPSVSGSVFKRMGLSPSVKMSPPTRLRVQWAILEESKLALSAHRSGFVTDRTPLDFMAYLLCSQCAGAAPQEIDTEMMRYVRECYDALEQFKHLVVVQPGLPIVDAPNKAAPNPALMESLNALVIGLGMDARTSKRLVVMPRECVELQTRIGFCECQVDPWRAPLPGSLVRKL
jgi:hypothetical protein